VEILKFCKKLQEESKEYNLSNQLMRSGTSIGANIRECKNGFSKADFVYKFSISQKECAESIYWLELINRIYNQYSKEIAVLLDEAFQLLKIIKTIIIRTRENSERLK